MCTMKIINWYEVSESASVPCGLQGVAELITDLLDV